MSKRTIQIGPPLALFGTAVAELWSASIHAARVEGTTEIYQILKALGVSVPAVRAATERLREVADRKHGEGRCRKVPHDDPGGGYLHGENDDQSYDVDGIAYCGRCHRSI